MPPKRISLSSWFPHDEHDCSLFRNGNWSQKKCRLETMYPLFHSLYKNTSVVVCKNSTHPSNRRVCNLNFPLWTCIHHRVVVYLNVSSRNMVTFSFCKFSNVVFFAYIMWNETLHIYLRWSPCIMVALSDESFQSKQFNIIKSPSTQIAIIKTWALWLNKELSHYCHVAIIIVPSVFYLLLHLFFSPSPRRRL
jgi:hypothetical protein